MAKGPRFLQTGFSLVELLVAVMFIGLLMAGMANVFQSSVSTLATSSEGISSGRRNRMSIDLLYDDLNTAALYITDLTAPPSNVTPTNPVFYVLANMPIGAPGLPTPDPINDPQTSDELFFYLDQPLPFEGTLNGTGGGGGYQAKSASQLVNVQGVAGGVVDNTYSVDCKDPSYAALVKKGCSVLIKDSWDIMTIDQDPPPPTGNVVTFHVAANATVAMTGIGAYGAPAKTSHIPDSAVLVFQPAQMVHYAVRMKLFDPQKPKGIPCLVREQEDYNPNGWDAAAPTLVQTIIAENVAGPITASTGKTPTPGFKIYLSANAGVSWAGLSPTGVPKIYTDTSLANDWTSGMRADLDTQLVGRPDISTTVGHEDWIRDVPTLVRFDITTRTATQRSEYSTSYNNPNSLAVVYKTFTQSLVIVPRHSGLAMN
jgi:type II secretory pathway pseudopilin PulG